LFNPIHPAGYYVKEYEFILIKNKIVPIDANSSKEGKIQDTYELK
jgi:hypothetical protein